MRTPMLTKMCSGLQIETVQLFQPKWPPGKHPRSRMQQDVLDLQGLEAVIGFPPSPVALAKKPLETGGLPQAQAS